MTALIIHGHFYQPPRENPWTGIVEVEPTAAPFHDWNERIHSECYQPNAVARITDPTTGRERIINNYANISFNFGPTLLRAIIPVHIRASSKPTSKAPANVAGMAMRSLKLTVMRSCRCAMNTICGPKFAGVWRTFEIGLGVTRKRCGCQRQPAMTTSWTR